MTKHFKRPLSIILAVLMVISVFIAVPTVASAEPGGASVDYYIVGTMNNWTVSDAYKLTVNPNNSAEYLFQDLSVSANTELKVKDSNGTWYPGGGNFTLNSAGTYDIYFRPDGQGDQSQGWYYGNILANNYREPTYTVTWKNGNNVIEEDTGVESGAAPSYGGATPTKAADETNHYTFSGWTDGTTTYGLNDTLPAVSGDVTYTAVFTEAAHTFNTTPTFNWTQDASTGDWKATKLTLSCECGDTMDYTLGLLGVTTTANADGTFTYTATHKVGDVTYTDSKVNNANGVIMTNTQLRLAATAGGEWTLGADVTKVVSSAVADGFVLNGGGHKVTAQTSTNLGSALFKPVDANSSFTLNDVILDGGNKRYHAVSSYTGDSNNSDNHIVLNGVTVQNFKSGDYAGAVYAYGSATIELNDCTVTGNANKTTTTTAANSGKDIWAGAKATIILNDGEYGEVLLHGGTANVTVKGDAEVDTVRFGYTTAGEDSTKMQAVVEEGTVGEFASYTDFVAENIVIDPVNATVPTPEDYKWVDSEEAGMKTLAPKEYVAQVNDGQKYETLAEAITAAADGDTTTVLADIDLGTSRINVKKSVNFDLGGKTITGSGNAIFVVYPNKTVSIENGTIENTATTSNHYTIVGNASTVNLGDGAKLAGGYQTYSGAAGAVLNVNEGSTIENTTSFGAAIYNNAVLNVNGGTIKAAVPITTLGTSGNGGYEINISAGTVESTDAGELNITGGTIKGGSEAAVYIKSGTTEISGGTFTSDGEAVKYDSTGSGYAPLDKIEISGGTFSNDVDIYAAPGYVGTQLSATTFGVKVDDNPLGLAPIIGYQRKVIKTEQSTADTDNDIKTKGVRIVTKVGGCDLTQFDEYGYVVVKVTGKEQATANFNNMKAYGGNGEKTIKCNGTVNTIDGYGTPYVTLAVNGMNDGDQVAARFYAIKDGVTYYSNYVSTARYNGIIATY